MWFLVVTNSDLEAALVKILPEENRLLIRSTAHTIDLTYLVIRIPQGGDRFMGNIPQPNGEVENFSMYSSVIKIPREV
jgi:hypothetical protein